MSPQFGQGIVGTATTRPPIGGREISAGDEPSPGSFPAWRICRKGSSVDSTAGTPNPPVKAPAQGESGGKLGRLLSGALGTARPGTAASTLPHRASAPGVAAGTSKSKGWT